MLSFTLSFLFAFTVVHPFHVSVCSIYHAPEEQTLQITQKIFADDLEEALNASTATATIDILNPSDPAVLNTIIEAYLGEHLQINVNGEGVAFQFLGYEREDMALWCYLEVEGVSEVETIRVRSTILIDAFDDQTNIVHVKYRNATKSMRLAKDYPEDQLNFK